ncbi:serine hydrolase [Nostoc sp. FACHB-145]|uniref:serine hydrolase n=1 Tax=Nostoc sp. FACHB-145 TaxID=2692836 RepID=UPI0018EF5953|nr:serine hydrolase [Nostoc sp. FACHB-145]
MDLSLKSRRRFMQLMGMSSTVIILSDLFPNQHSLAVAESSAWIARHGLTAEQYQSEFNKYTAQGFRPVQVSGYGVGNQDFYAVIFKKTANAPEWVARHGLTSEQYQSEFNKYTAQGFRPVQVSGYGVGNQDLYAVIFEKTVNAPAWVARHGLTAEQYQSEFNKYTAQGFRPVDVSGYTVGNQDLYAVIFEKTANAPAWVARHGMTSEQYQSEFDKYINQGFRLTKVSGYSLNGQDRYTALWEKSESGAWVARHGMSSVVYQDEFDRYFYQGYRPVWVNGYTVNGEDRYAAIWESQNGYNSSELLAIDQTVAEFMQNYDVPGLSLAIAKDGRLVLAKTYGLADKSANERVAPRHRFRIASVSKPITAIAIMKLLEQGQLRLSDRIFGQDGILGTTYGTIPYQPNVEQITVEHLLSHLGGGWSNSSNDPMFSNPSMNHTQLISWVLDNRSLDNAPGTKYAYSNFGFCVLGRVIETVTGQTYENYIKTNILEPCGITDMQISGDTLAEKKVNEVTYYGQSNEDPYGMKVARMDAHGGWIAKPIDLVRLSVQVDGINPKPDILGANTIVAMYQGSSINSGYAKGWSVNSANNHWHNGSLPGEQAFLVNTSDGFSWAVLVNTRSPKSNFGGDLDQLMWKIRSKVTNWPSFDLF